MTEPREAPLEPHRVIDAFLDGERVDGESLKDALATTEGRDHLVDVLALREWIEATEPSAEVLRPRRRSPRWLGLAAAVLVAALGGYAFGHARGNRAAPQMTSAPQPTRVIDLRPGVEWHEIRGGH